MGVAGWGLVRREAGRVTMRRACRDAQMSVRMTLAARIVEVLAENRVIARASSRGTAPGGSNVILTDTRDARRYGLRPALAG